MGSKAGVLKVAAKRVGVSIDEYTQRIAAGEKWCSQCRGWKSIDCFNVDRSRGDGLTTKCHACTRVKERRSTKGRPSAFKGAAHTAETKAKMSAARKGKPSPAKGVSRSIEFRAKISAALRETAARGPACHSFKDGKLAERRDQRFSQEYKRWRFDVFLRDRFTCQHCGDDRGGNLRAHHIKSFADHPELRFDVANGLTLCDTCHDAEHAK
jgi:hypothetical protein